MTENMNDMDLYYHKKYLKYKNKYLNLVKQYGGNCPPNCPPPRPPKSDRILGEQNRLANAAALAAKLTAAHTDRKSVV
jgi:hypothetical protein